MRSLMLMCGLFFVYLLPCAEGSKLEVKNVSSFYALPFEIQYHIFTLAFQSFIQCTHDSVKNKHKFKATIQKDDLRTFVSPQEIEKSVYDRYKNISSLSGKVSCMVEQGVAQRYEIGSSYVLNNCRLEVSDNKKQYVFETGKEHVIEISDPLSVASIEKHSESAQRLLVNKDAYKVYMQPAFYVFNRLYNNLAFISNNYLFISSIKKSVWTLDYISKLPFKVNKDKFVVRFHPTKPLLILKVSDCEIYCMKLYAKHNYADAVQMLLKDNYICQWWLEQKKDL